MFPGSKTGVDGRLVVSASDIVSYNAGFGYTADQALAMAVGGPADPYWANVVLLVANDNKPNGTITLADQSTLANTFTRTAPAQYSSGRAPAGMTTSLLMQGTTPRFVMAQNFATSLLTGDFTIEFYLFNNAAVVFGNLESSGGGAGGWLVVGYAGPPWRFHINGAQLFQAATTLGAAWAHVAVVRSAGQIRGYINGVLDAGPFADASSMNTGQLSIGPSGTGGTQDWSISNVRVTKAARYLSNFTPPTLPLPTS